MNGGWIKLHSKMQKWGWYDSPDTLALWIHILLSANYKKTEWHGEIYEEGSFPTSIEKLSIETGLSCRAVRTCLERLKKTGEISVISTNKGTKINVVKWAEYQGHPDDTDMQNDKPDDKQTTNERQANDKQTTTITEYKNKRIEDINNKRFKKPTVEEIREYCRERGNSIDPEQFWNYYESNGWKVGKNAMKDWRACIRSSWEKNHEAKKDVMFYDTNKNKKLSDKELDDLLSLRSEA